MCYGNMLGIPTLLYFVDLNHTSPIQLAARSTAWVYGRPPADITNSNPGGDVDVDVDVCLL